MGYPVLPTRNAFGPTLKDSGKITDPERQIPATAFNLAWHQLSGVGLVSPIALLVVDGFATGATTLVQRLAWDPNGAIALLGWVRTGAGIYTCQFAGTYNDEQGNVIATNLMAGKPWILGLNDRSDAFAKMLSASQVEVRTYNASATLTDLDFILPLYRA